MICMYFQSFDKCVFCTYRMLIFSVQLCHDKREKIKAFKDKSLV